MVSNLVMLSTAILHIGLQTSIFVPTDRFPVPGTLFANWMVYCGLLHFLQDVALLPRHYRCRMGGLASFLIEVVLSIFFMEVLAMFLWTRIEANVCFWLKTAMGYSGGEAEGFYLQHETIILGSLTTSIAAGFWLSAALATDPWECNEKQPETEGKTLQQVAEELQQQMDNEVSKQQLEELEELKLEKDLQSANADSLSPDV